MTTEKRRLFVNFSSLMIGFFSVRCISFLATLYSTNHLGPTRFGILSSALALALIFSVFINAGLDDYLVREIANTPEQINRLFGDALLMKLLLFPLALVVIGIIAWLNGEHGWVFVWLGLYSIAHSFLMICCAMFRGIERMIFQTILQVIQTVLIALGTVTAIVITDDVTITATTYVIATVIALALAIRLLHKNNIHPVLNWDISTLKKRFYQAFPYGINYASLLLFDRITIICIAIFIGDAGVGLFSSVYNITLILTTIPQIVTAATLPLLVRRSRDGSHLIRDVMSMMVRYIFIISIGLALALIAGAPLIIGLFDPQYASAKLILQILALSMPFLFFTLLMINILEAVGEQHICAATIGKCLGLSIPLSVFSAYYWGYLGATTTYVITHFLLAWMLFRIAASKVGWTNLRQTIVMPWLAGIVMAGVIFIGKSWSPWLVTMTTSIGYGGILIINGAIGVHDLRFFTTTLRRST